MYYNPVNSGEPIINNAFITNRTGIFCHLLNIHADFSVSVSRLVASDQFGDGLSVAVPACQLSNHIPENMAFGCAVRPKGLARIDGNPGTVPVGVGLPPNRVCPAGAWRVVSFSEGFFATVPPVVEAVASAQLPSG